MEKSGQLTVDNEESRANRKWTVERVGTVEKVETVERVGTIEWTMKTVKRIEIVDSGQWIA